MSIVVGFDGSEDSVTALNWAVSEARLREASVSVYHCWHWPYSYEAGVEAQRVMQVAEEMLSRTPDVDSTCVLVPGGASQQLIEASVEAALLVVGARGQGGFPGLLSGSVSVQVARHARCPVVVVQTHSIGDGAATGKPGRILVGVDGSDSSRDALEFAFDEAVRRHGPVHVVYAWDPNSLLTATFAAEPELERLRELTQQQLSSWLLCQTDDHPGVQVTAEFVHDSAASALVMASADADLVVLGSRGHSGLATLLLGSTTDTVMHHALCPTIVVPKPA